MKVVCAECKKIRYYAIEYCLGLLLSSSSIVGAQSMAMHGVSKQLRV